MKKRIIAKKFLWVDLEMTGLDPEKQVITEVAAIVTDIKLNEIATYESIIKHSKRTLDKADEWVLDNMQAVLEASAEAHKDTKEVEEDLVDFINKHFDDYVILAGNSIHQDRRFIRKHMPELEEKLHYRMLDVSAWKVYMMARFKLEQNKVNKHRALDDIRGSISELKSYLEFFKVEL